MATESRKRLQNRRYGPSLTVPNRTCSPLAHELGLGDGFAIRQGPLQQALPRPPHCARLGVVGMESEAQDLRALRDAGKQHVPIDVGRRQALRTL